MAPKAIGGSQLPMLYVLAIGSDTAAVVSEPVGSIAPGLRFERRFPTAKGGVLPLDEPGRRKSISPLALATRAGFSCEANDIAILRNSFKRFSLSI